MSRYDDREYYSSRPPPRRRYEDEVIDVDISRDRRSDVGRRQPDFLRPDNNRHDDREIVLRSSKSNNFGEERSRTREYEIDEDLLIRRRDPPRRREHSEQPPPRRRDDDREYIEIRESNDRRDNRSEIDVKIREDESRGPPPRRREDDREEIIFRRGEGERRRARDDEHEEIIIRRDTDNGPPRPEPSRERTTIDIRESESRGPPPRAPPPPRSDDREDLNIRISRDEHESRRRENDRESVHISRERSRSRRPVSRTTEEYYYKRRSPSPPPERQTEEIIIRQTRSPSPPPAPSPPPEAEVVLSRPPVHQDVIHHHYNVDHGWEKERSPSPSPSPERKENLEVEIRRRDAKGNVIDEDIRIIEKDGKERRKKHDNDSDRTSSVKEEIKIHERSQNHSRTRSRARSRARSSSEEKVDIKIETGANSSALVSVNQNDDRRVGHLIPQSRPPPREMWTEVTKDLVSKEAIEYAGYQYEETDEYFYIMEYLRYDDVVKLVDVSDSLHRDRRDRIDQIQWERKDPRLPDPGRWEHAPPRRALPDPRDDRSRYVVEEEWRRGPRRDEERVWEREVVYEDHSRGPPPRRYR